MWNIKEEDLNEFKSTCKNRLSPDWATGFMFGTMFFISLIMFFLLRVNKVWLELLPDSL